MNKTSKVLRVLSLFSDSRKYLTAADIVKQLQVSQATAYRYIQELKEVGFLVGDAPGSYVLGPALIRLDRLVREHDPLISASRELMQQLSRQTGATVLLARHVDGAVMSVAQAIGRYGPAMFSYERGRVMPLYQGSPAVVILANLSQAQLNERIAADALAIEAAGLPLDAANLYRSLTPIRQQGFAYTHGAVDQGVMGWSVAIRSANEVLGSFSALLDDTTPEVRPKKIIEELRRTALRIEARLD
ncbi:MAG TPA: IclR family transcriptional regulator [Burkholderiaceae bacterium]|nr:IclR family transcriptional regulator [Burkholderiaceae bacterium]